VSAGLWIAVGACGAAGALARFLLDGVVAHRFGAALPWGTFAVNVSGAFVLGLLVGAALTGDAALLAGTAAIGSYTTFSTWMLESWLLAEDGRPRLAALNVAGSLLIGLGAAELGRLLGGLL
jgi:CrcB protein